MNIVKSIKLFFQEGTSDKVYHATIVEEQGLYTVTVEWGRRGSTLNRGAKAVKVSLAQAEKAYDRLVRQKTTKGYEEITDSVAPAAVAPPAGQGSASKAGRTGRPRLAQQAQLLNTVEPEALQRLLADPHVVAQQKFDGMRVLTHLNPEPVATNRSGQIISLHPTVAAAVQAVAPQGGLVLDGELVTAEGQTIYWLFDLLEDGEDLRALPYTERHAMLQQLELEDPLRLVPTATTTAQKQALLQRLEQEHAEGIVFKRDDAAYSPGRPASGGPQLKYKFVKSADVFITRNAGNAYQMAVYDGDRLHPCGKVFAGTTNETRRELDDRLAQGETPVAEVRYLYATADDILYQPVFAQLRDDKEPGDCTLDQLVRTSRAAVEHAAPAPETKNKARKKVTKKVTK